MESRRETTLGIVSGCVGPKISLTFYYHILYSIETKAKYPFLLLWLHSFPLLNQKEKADIFKSSHM